MLRKMFARIPIPSGSVREGLDGPSLATQARNAEPATDVVAPAQPVAGGRAWVLISVLGGYSLIASPAVAAPPSAEAALALQPVQSDVPYFKVAKEDIASCRVTDLRENGWSGWTVEAADGTRLRRFADTNGDKKIDLWCYYDQGIEVYRDVDSDFNGKADQYRWLGTAGTRWGVDKNEDGKIDYWKQISAEEASAELIAAIAKADVERFARLVATEQEIRDLGLGPATADRVAKKAAKATTDFAELIKQQKAVGPTARWVQFASTAPGIVPAGTDASTRDLRIYENAVAMYEDAGQSGQVMIGTLLQVGDTWRVVDVPQVVADDQPLAQTPGTFFTPGGIATAAAARPAMGAETQQLVSMLERIDRDLAAASAPAEQAELNRRRVDVVEQLIAASSTAVERDTWMRQLVDTVSVAVQSGVYPEGLERLRRFSNDLPSSEKELQAYVQFQLISTEYVKRQVPDADFAKVQEWYLTELTKFVEQFPTSPEAAQALLQLALSKEFEEKETEALEYYNRVAKSFSGTDMGEKAAGAVVRLESKGKVLAFKGRTVKGEAFDLAKLQGRPVIIHYWATWCEACKHDMKLLRQLQAKYQNAGLQIVGVNVDSTRSQAEAYLQANSAPWIHLYEDGGLQSSGLAKQLGVQTLPMMLLIDDKGRVVSNNIYAASLDTELAKIARPTAAAATAPRPR